MRVVAHQKQQGYIVLITVLILGIAAATISLFLLITGTDASLASSGVEAGVEARAGASACAELALDTIQANPSLVTPASDSSILDSSTGQQCNYQISGSSPNYTIDSTGTVQSSTESYVHHMSLTIDQVAPKLNVSSWQDVP